MRIERRAAGAKTRYKEMANAAVSSRSITLSSDAPLPFELAMNTANGERWCVALTIEEVEELERDIAEYRRRQRTVPAFALRDEPRRDDIS